MDPGRETLKTKRAKAAATQAGEALKAKPGGGSAAKSGKEEEEEKAGAAWLPRFKEQARGAWGYTFQKLRELLPSAPKPAGGSQLVRVASGPAQPLPAWSSRAFQALPAARGAGFLQRLAYRLAAATERRPALMGGLYVSAACVAAVLLSYFLRYRYNAASVEADLGGNYSRSRLYESAGPSDRLPVLYGLSPGPVGNDLLTMQPSSLSTIPSPQEGGGRASLNYVELKDDALTGTYWGSSASSALARTADSSSADGGQGAAAAGGAGAATGGAGAGLGLQIAAGTTNKLKDRKLVLPYAPQSSAYTAAPTYGPGAPGARVPSSPIPDSDFQSPGGGDPFMSLPPGLQGENLLNAMLAITSSLQGAQMTQYFLHPPSLHGVVPLGTNGNLPDPNLWNYNANSMFQSMWFGALEQATYLNITAVHCGGGSGCNPEPRVQKSRATYFGETFTGGQ